MALRPAAFSAPVDEVLSLAALLIVATLVAVAAAWKSAAARAGLPPKPPDEIATVHVPCVVNGFVPDTRDRLTCNVAEVMVAPSGIDDVSNERIPMYCRLPELSPTRIL